MELTRRIGIKIQDKELEKDNAEMKKQIIELKKEVPKKILKNKILEIKKSEFK